MNGDLGFREEDLCLLMDLYELTMCASYFENKRFEPATFDLFVRKLPPNRSYLLLAGLEHVLRFIEKFRFRDEHLEYLRRQGFREDFLNYLRNFKFTGDVWAIPEGTVVFPNEPLIRVTAPIIEAQLLETFILNTINLQTTIATKASRIVYAAKGRPVIEFGLRREHGIDAGMKVARASYIAGCIGTSNVLAGMKYGIPIFGTMAHSFIMFFGDEVASFKAFARTFPDKSIFLIDTFDTLKGAENAIKAAKELEKNGFKLQGVRLDSGDLAGLSKKVRRMLNENGLNYVKILASGDLDEYRIDELLNSGAEIDSFGVGTKLGTSADRPYVDIIYKLSEKMNDKGEFQPIMKLSEGKATLPGRKQVFRFKDEHGKFMRDVIALEDEEVDGEPLLVKVIEKGNIIYDYPSIEDIRKRALENLSRLPDKYKKLVRPAEYPVQISLKLKKLMNDLERRLKGV
ncbi:MAG: nicotinate phosphoribosyltransferase [Nitrososphaerota archaeon]|nr:nicotinate phosphoribosyltransferase [Candidatus Bathyarchaeota archaeon]MDW8193675.1 nicotinate phosphoribosyltransferase [Nitrososphaerota archaeon]